MSNFNPDNNGQYFNPQWPDAQHPQQPPPPTQSPPQAAQPPTFGAPQQLPPQSPPQAAQPPQFGAQQPPPPGMPPSQPFYGYPPAGVPQPVTPRGSKVPMIAVIALASATLLGLATTLFFTLGSNDHDTGSVSDPKQSESKKDSSSSPSSSSSSADEGSQDELSESSYDDWDFKLGDVELSADKIDGWDFDDCSGLEEASALTDLGCESAVEVAYEAEDGDLIVVNFLMVMSDLDAAEEAGEKGTLSPKDFSPHNESFVDHPDFGDFRSGNTDGFAIFTAVTAEKGVDSGDAKDYLEYMFEDQSAALSFK